MLNAGRFNLSDIVIWLVDEQAEGRVRLDCSSPTSGNIWGVELDRPNLPRLARKCLKPTSLLSTAHIGGRLPWLVVLAGGEG